jgi:hypothetical protein
MTGLFALVHGEDGFVPCHTGATRGLERMFMLGMIIDGEALRRS